MVLTTMTFAFATLGAGICQVFFTATFPALHSFAVLPYRVLVARGEVLSVPTGLAKTFSISKSFSTSKSARHKCLGERSESFAFAFAFATALAFSSVTSFAPWKPIPPS